MADAVVDESLCGAEFFEIGRVGVTQSLWGQVGGDR